MKIALDTSSLYVTRAGTSRYVSGLLRGLKELRVDDIDINEIAWRVNNFEYSQPFRAIKTAYREFFWSRIVAPIEMRRMRADLLHRCTTALPIALPRRVREVVTLHDVAVLRHPERFRRWHREAEIRRFRLLRRADRIICDSRFTANEAMNLLGIPSDKLEVVHLASGMRPGRSGLPSCSVPLPAEYFLFVGSLEPGKNLNLLGQVYAHARQLGNALPPLVVVGARRPGVEHEEEWDRGWIWLGYQPDDVLQGLYSGAMALVFPSKYEGFGLPVLEAMSMGCPVVCSPVASIPEVAGAAVYYANMTTSAYLGALKELMSSDRRRNELSQAGIIQACRFSWATCATQVVEIYRSVWR